MRYFISPKVRNKNSKKRGIELRKVIFGYKGILLSVFLVFLLATNTQAAVEWGVDAGDWASWTVISKDEEGKTLGSIGLTVEVVSINPDGTIDVEFKWYGSTSSDTWSATENSAIVAISELETAEQQNKGLKLEELGGGTTSAVEKKDYNYQGKINGESVDKTMNAYMCTYSNPLYTVEYWWDQKAGILYEEKIESKSDSSGVHITLEDTNASLASPSEEMGLCPFTITVATIPVAAFVILEAKKRKME